MLVKKLSNRFEELGVKISLLCYRSKGVANMNVAQTFYRQICWYLTGIFLKNFLNVTLARFKREKLLKLLCSRISDKTRDTKTSYLVSRLQKPLLI